MPKNVLKIILPILIVAGGLTYYSLLAQKSELNFDGAIYSQGAISLLKYGVYDNYLYDKSTLSQFRFGVFSQGMISQYLLNIPIIFILGINTFSLQITNLLFLLLTAFLIYSFILKTAKNYLLALLALILYFTFPGMNYSGLAGLGEFPSFFYLLLTAFLLLKSYENPKYFPLLGGSLFLAFHTKFFLALLFPILFFIIGYTQVYKKEGTILQLLWFILWFAAPLFLLNILYVASYGFQDIRYHYVVDMSHSIKSNLFPYVGTGVKQPLVLNVLTNLKSAWQDIIHLWWNPYVYYFSLFLTYGICLAIFWKDLKKRFPLINRPEGNKGQSERIVLLFLFSSSLVYMVWHHFGWMTFGFRRMVPIFLLNDFLAVFAFGLWAWLRENHSKKMTRLIGALIFIPLLWIHAVKFVESYGVSNRANTSVQDRQEMVDYLSKLPEDKRIFGLGWWQAPRLSLFSSKIFLDFEKNQGHREGYLVLDDVALLVEPNLIQETLERYGLKYHFELAKMNNHYIIFKWVLKN